MGVARVETIQVRTDFSPQRIATLETDWVFHDSKGQYTQAYECQAGAIQHQFGLSRAGAESVLSTIRPHADEPPLHARGQLSYYAELGNQIGRYTEIRNTYDTPLDGLINILRNGKKTELEREVRFNTRVWSAIYGISEDQLEPIMRKRVETFFTLFDTMKSGHQPDWVQLQSEQVEYYTKLHALVFPAV